MWNTIVTHSDHRQSTKCQFTPKTGEFPKYISIYYKNKTLDHDLKQNKDFNDYYIKSTYIISLKI